MPILKVMPNWDFHNPTERPIPRFQGTLRPLFNQVTIRPDPLSDSNPSGSLVVPESAKTPDPIRRGVVLAVGGGAKYVPRVHNDPSRLVKRRAPLPLAPGDVVMYHPRQEIIDDTGLVHVTPVEHVYGVVEP